MHTRQFHERLSRLSNNTHSLRSPLDSLDLETVPRLERRHFAQDVRQVGVGNSTRSPPPTPPPTPLHCPSYPPHPAEPRLTRTAGIYPLPPPSAWMRRGFSLPRHQHSRAAVLLPLRAAMAGALQTTVCGPTLPAFCDPVTDLPDENC
jgi:hypothetical protein